jgi:hypothetical protein
MTPYAGAANNRPIKDGTLTTRDQVMTHETEARRRELYRWAIGLSVAYVADGILWTWALITGPYAGSAYMLVSFFPVFIPACILGLVASRLYWQGFTRHGWTARKAEWLFFFLLYNAVAAKVIVSIYDWVR